MARTTRKPNIYHKILMEIEQVGRFTSNAPRTSWGVVDDTFKTLEEIAILAIDARNAGDLEASLEVLCKMRVLIDHYGCQLDVLTKLHGISIKQLAVLGESLREITVDFQKWHDHILTSLNEGKVIN